MNTPELEKVLKILKNEIKKWKVPAVGVIADQALDRPFETLISCVLSLRTKDAVTEVASRRLLGEAPTPQAMVRLTPSAIEKLIYPVGFYRTKAKSIIKTCRILIDRYNGKVPRTIEELLELPGVGRKTANLVVTVGYGDYGICVDTHVHRISNRFGYVKTKTPEETEFALRKKLPKKEWKTYNDILVTFGQNLCAPISPWCSKCAIEEYCPKIGVPRSR
ncbi:MAG: endonuclease III [Deltaproteobacteria bacterium]|nr:endonuclease III [Deltaproteobacteria bacterium]